MSNVKARGFKGLISYSELVLFCRSKNLRLQTRKIGSVEADPEGLKKILSHVSETDDYDLMYTKGSVVYSYDLGHRNLFHKSAPETIHSF